MHVIRVCSDHRYSTRITSQVVTNTLGTGLGTVVNDLHHCAVHEHICKSSNFSWYLYATLFRVKYKILTLFISKISDRDISHSLNMPVNCQAAMHMVIHSIWCMFWWAS